MRIKNKKKKLNPRYFLNEKVSAKDHYRSVMQKYGPTVPAIDSDEYPERPGLEGPFRFKDGSVLYYDPKEGSYYDAGTDLYVEPPLTEEIEGLQEENARCYKERWLIPQNLINSDKQEIIKAFYASHKDWLIWRVIGIEGKYVVFTMCSD